MFAMTPTPAPMMCAWATDSVRSQTTLRLVTTRMPVPRWIAAFWASASGPRHSAAARSIRIAWDWRMGTSANGTLFCDKENFPYQCKVDPNTVVVCPLPTGSDAGCNEPICASQTGTCGFVPAHQADFCDDGFFCTKSSVCNAGHCMGLEANCEDNNVCTADTCDENNDVCGHTPAPGFCTDNDYCTEIDVCADGKCVSGAPRVCEDDNVCTENTCQPAVGCVYPPKSGSCTDNNHCTDGDTCVDGKCMPGGPLVCNDGIDCTQDICLPDSGCVLVGQQHGMQRPGRLHRWGRLHPDRMRFSLGSGLYVGVSGDTDILRRRDGMYRQTCRYLWERSAERARRV